MITIISVLLFIVFAFLSAIHFYWGLGGRWGSQAVFPTKDDNVKPKMPGVLPTLIVAFGLLAIGLFILRAIGDFNYLGFFKKIKQTKFGINDTKYYSPLCLTIGILTIIMELNK